ncbi:phosducin-like protein 3 isoform X1 [Camellia sinensis]|uniref:phosducin-like protein 3 isoform X1 n=1 Tax=Camellia sinensis TaxID=4442 RepID=UPI001035B437|nr:phosducin-like protein 3 isoform X1 [Camellia sinensis]
MANYHFVYKDVEGVSTQWDDIQRKLGDLPPKPPAFKPPSFTPVEDKDSKHKDNAWIDDRTEEQLEDLEDDPDLDDDRFLQEYRLTNMAGRAIRQLLRGRLQSQSSVRISFLICSVSYLYFTSAIL